MIFAAIPSPSSDALELGPLTFRFYGLAIAFGVLAGVWLAQKRWTAVGGGPDDMSRVAMWAVPAGLIGARLYHLTTDWRFDEGFVEALKIWEGGLGIPGGMAAGIFAALWFIRREGWDRAKFLDAAVPGLPLAQAIGRFGNWFNQELYGKPSDLPWAVEIAPENRLDQFKPEGATPADTFQPAFFYESLWNFALVVFLIWVHKTKKVRTGSLLAVYVLGYLIARLWLETVRIDEATLVGGVRVNIWMSITGIVLAGGWLLLRGRPDEPSDDTHSDNNHSDNSGSDNSGSDDSASDDSDSDDSVSEDSVSDDSGTGVEEVEMASPDDGAS
jgi:phosphatidylglycerol---prolipoprotein diacylglyceryl transferase